MTKQEMIDELLTEHKVDCVRDQLEVYTEAELKDWLESLES